MKSLAFTLSLLSFTLPVTAASAEVVFDQAAQTASHDCGTDPVVSIQGASGTFTITGACTSIEVEGASNKLTIAQVAKLEVVGSSNEIDVTAADKIEVVGSSNEVRWKRGVKGAKAKVSNVGTANKIRKVK